MHHSAPFFEAALQTEEADYRQTRGLPSIAERAEQFLQAEGRGLNPHYRVTQDDVQREIVSELYFTGLDGVTGEQHRQVGYYDHRTADEDALRRITFCVLVLKSGVRVVGVEHCQDGVELDEAIGRQGALQDALRQVWPLVIHERKARIARGE